MATPITERHRGERRHAAARWRDRWIDGLLIGWFILVGFVVRWHGLDQYAYSPDDVLILGIAQSETLGGLWTASTREVHPPLFYLVLRMFAAVASSEGFLRGAMIGASLLAVPIAFCTGRRFIGRVGAVVMALSAALALGVVVETGSLRHYSLVVPLAFLGWHTFLRYREQQSTRSLWAYTTVVLLGVWSHYSLLLLFGAIGITHLVALVSTRGNRRFAKSFVLLHLPAIATAGYFVWSHIALQWAGNGHYDFIVNHAYRALFPQTAIGWLENSFWLGIWLTFPVYGGIVAISVALWGIVAMSRRRAFALLSVMIAVLVFQLIATAAKQYPLGNTRHCLYLLPFVAFALGHGAESIMTLGTRLLARLRLRPGPAVPGVVVVCLASLGIVVDYLDGTHLRDRYSHSSFPVRRLAHEELFSAYQEHVPPGSRVLSNRQSSMYMRYAARTISGREFSGPVRTVHYEGSDVFYFDDRSAARSGRQLEELLSIVSRGAGFGGDEPIYLFSVGWNSAFIEKLAVDDDLTHTERLVKNDAGALLRIHGDRLQRLLTR